MCHSYSQGNHIGESKYAQSIVIIVKGHCCSVYKFDKPSRPHLLIIHNVKMQRQLCFSPVFGILHLLEDCLLLALIRCIIQAKPFYVF